MWVCFFWGGTNHQLTLSASVGDQGERCCEFLLIINLSEILGPNYSFLIMLKNNYTHHNLWEPKSGVLFSVANSQFTLHDNMLVVLNVQKPYLTNFLILLQALAIPLNDGGFLILLHSSYFLTYHGKIKNDDRVLCCQSHNKTCWVLSFFNNHNSTSFQPPTFVFFSRYWGQCNWGSARNVRVSRLASYTWRWYVSHITYMKGHMSCSVALVCACLALITFYEYKIIN